MRSERRRGSGGVALASSLLGLALLVAIGFWPYTSTKSVTWASEQLAEPGYTGPTTSDHAVIMTAVATGDCSGVWRHDPPFARPDVRFADGHLGPSTPYLVDNPCEEDQATLSRGLLAAIAGIAVLAVVLAARWTSRRNAERRLPTPPDALARRFE